MTMPETVLLFDLFGVIAHHQSPEGRNRLFETVALSCTATGAFWDHSWLEMFQVRGFSCRIGRAKPNPAAFRWCLDALAVPADQSCSSTTARKTSKPRKPSA